MVKQLLENPLQALRYQELPKQVDLIIVVLTLLLAIFGVVMVASSSIAIASDTTTGPFYFLIRHTFFLGLGFSLAILFLCIPLHHWYTRSRILLLISFLLLLAVFVPGLGRRINGATRWLNLGIMGFQAVEAVKLFLVIYLASYLARFSTQVTTSITGILKPLALVVLMVGLLLLQPDFGSSMLILSITFCMILLGGARLRDLGVLFLIGTPVMIAAALAEPYRIKRLTSFLNPWEDPFNAGFQLSQALIAIGRGEWFGVGLGGSIQKLFYLPEAHTDFIFAVIAEETGLVGIIVVLSLFALLCNRAFSIGLRCLHQGMLFGGYCAFGISLWISIQTLVSVGVNLGVLPTKGLTLPLISSGGSSLLITCAAIGLLLRISYELNQKELAANLATQSTDHLALTMQQGVTA